MIFTTENFLKDNGDKIPADKKPGIEQALQQLKDAHKAGDVAAIDTAIANLNNVMQAASAADVSGWRTAGRRCSGRCWRSSSRLVATQRATRQSRMQTSRR